MVGRFFTTWKTIKSPSGLLWVSIIRIPISPHSRNFNGLKRILIFETHSLEHDEFPMVREQSQKVGFNRFLNSRLVGEH